MQGKLSVERMCALSAVSRAGCYRSLQEREPDLEEVTTTDSDHELLVHLNLASRMQLNGINQE